MSVSPWTDDNGLDILEIIKDQNARHFLTAEKLGLLFKRCPIYQLEAAWKLIASPCKFPPTPTEISKNEWLRHWTPVTFKDAATRAYHRYSPCLLETSTKLYYIIGFKLSSTHPKDQEIRNWTSLPPLNFLPPGVDRVVAGSAGLLVMEGGDQPGNKPILLWGQPKTPNAKFWRNPKAKEQCGGQSLVCITNPLTREYLVLPPIPKRRLNGKIAKFVFSDTRRCNYHLVIAGWDAQKKKGRLRDILSVVVYSSEKRSYIHANYIENARPLPYFESGRSGIAVINYGVYFGGVRVRLGKSTEELHIPAIYYFNISETRRQRLCFDFILINITSRQVQAPKVVQAGPFQVFAVTRYAQLPTIIMLLEVELTECGSPSGNYKNVKNGIMPTDMYQRLFPSAAEALLPYEASSVDGRIAIKALSSSNWIAMYDITTHEWMVFQFPHLHEQKQFQLCDGCYEPVFTARP